jgi:hypothetical protein
LDDTFAPLSAVERFDPLDGSWEKLPAPQLGRIGPPENWAKKNVRFYG